jgi:hypothetical protein
MENALTLILLLLAAFVLVKSSKIPLAGGISALNE